MVTVDAWSSAWSKKLDGTLVYTFLIYCLIYYIVLKYHQMSDMPGWLGRSQVSLM